MAPQRIIHIRFPTNKDGSLDHQVLNLAEDLWHRIELAGFADLGGLKAVDSASDHIMVRIFHARKVRSVRKLVEDIIAKHMLDDRAILTFE